MKTHQKLILTLLISFFYAPLTYAAEEKHLNSNDPAEAHYNQYSHPIIEEPDNELPQDQYNSNVSSYAINPYKNKNNVHGSSDMQLVQNFDNSSHTSNFSSSALMHFSNDSHKGRAVEAATMMAAAKNFAVNVKNASDDYKQQVDYQHARVRKSQSAFDMLSEEAMEQEKSIEEKLKSLVSISKGASDTKLHYATNFGAEASAIQKRQKEKMSHDLEAVYNTAETAVNTSEMFAMQGKRNFDRKMQALREASETSINIKEKHHNQEIRHNEDRHKQYISQSSDKLDLKKREDQQVVDAQIAKAKAHNKEQQLRQETEYKQKEYDMKLLLKQKENQIKREKMIAAQQADQNRQARLASIKEYSGEETNTSYRYNTKAEYSVNVSGTGACTASVTLIFYSEKRRTYRIEIKLVNQSGKKVSSYMSPNITVISREDKSVNYRFQITESQAQKVADVKLIFRWANDD